jgi:DNA-directed RNA polymerase subunit RPC12/RpoP
MCSVGDPFNIDIATENIELCKFKCNECGKEFKGISVSNIKCPNCHSKNTSKIES